MPFPNFPSYPRLDSALLLTERRAEVTPFDHTTSLSTCRSQPFPKLHFETIARVEWEMGAISSPATGFLTLLEGRACERYIKSRVELGEHRPCAKAV